MNHGFSFSLPRGVFGNKYKDDERPVLSNTPLAPQPITQSQTSNTTPTNIPYNSTAISTDELILNPTSPLTKITNQPNNPPSVPNNPPSVVILHHQNTTKYVLSDYCFPVSESLYNTNTTNQCKFSNRDCVVSKTKVFIEGKKIPHLSETVFSSGATPYKKNNYNTIDTRLIACFNKMCKSTTTKKPKCFHYCCFMHMMSSKSNDGLEFVELDGPNDKVLTLVDKNIDIKKIVDDIKDINTKLIFPVCGKRCFNTVVFTRQKKTTKVNSEYATAHSWDSDGSETKKSSIEVLIDWITTEEHASSYFGGVDTAGNTNATRKEGYHHQIRDIIKEENGECIDY